MTEAGLENFKSTEAPRRASKDGIKPSGNGVKTTITVLGNSYDVSDGKLEEVAARLALEATMKKKPRAAGVGADHLKSLISRVERLEGEKAGIASDIKDVFAEAKSNGFDVPTMKKVIKIRAMDAAERDEAEHLLDTYLVSLGMKPQMELFEEAE